MSVKETIDVVMSVSTHWEVMSVLANLDLAFVMMAEGAKVRLAIYIFWQVIFKGAYYFQRRLTLQKLVLT